MNAAGDSLPAIRKGTWRYRFLALAGLALIRVFEASVRRFADAPAFPAASKFPWTSQIEARWLDARDEALALLVERGVPSFEEISEEQARIVRPGTWKAFMFYTYGHKVAANCERCPKTTALLESIPGMTLGMFSILTPHSRIAPHRGLYNGVLRYHLALLVPPRADECGIRIAGETRHWEEGKSLVFDDTYEHETWNDTDESRVVLFVDFLRELPAPLSWLNRALLTVIGRSPYVQNMLVNLAALQHRAA